MITVMMFQGHFWYSAALYRGTRCIANNHIDDTSTSTTTTTERVHIPSFKHVLDKTTKSPSLPGGGVAEGEGFLPGRVGLTVLRETAFEHGTQMAGLQCSARGKKQDSRLDIYQRWSAPLVRAPDEY